MPTKDKQPTEGTPKLDKNLPEDRAKGAGKKSENAKRAKKVLGANPSAVRNLTSTGNLSDE